jgi:predicted O-methyltransferase YrrM
MPDFVDPKVEQYVTSLVPPREPVLADVERDAEINRVPIIGPLEGQLLAVIARIAGVRTVLEVGTATGYSAIWLARVASQNGGSFVGIELDPNRHAIASNNLERAGLVGSARVIQGDAREVLRSLDEQFDMVFLDLVRAIDDPATLRAILEGCINHLRVGGVLAIDNVLHGTEVIDPDSASARAAADLNQRLAEDERLEATFLTLRDGVAVAVKVRD